MHSGAVSGTNRAVALRSPASCRFSGRDMVNLQLLVCLIVCQRLSFRARCHRETSPQKRLCCQSSPKKLCQDLSCLCRYLRPLCLRNGPLPWLDFLEAQEASEALFLIPILPHRDRVGSFSPVADREFALSLSRSSSFSISLALSLAPSLSLCLSLPLYLSTSRPLYLSISLSLYLSTSLPLYLSTSLPLHLSISPSLYLSISLSLYLSISLSLYLSLRHARPGAFGIVVLQLVEHLG